MYTSFLSLFQRSIDYSGFPVPVPAPLPTDPLTFFCLVPLWCRYDDLHKKKEAEEARVAKMRAELASKEKRKAAKKGKTDEDGNRVERDDMDEEDPDSITAVRPTTEQSTGTRSI